MANPRYKVNSQKSLLEACYAAADYFVDHKYFWMSFSCKRSQDQNALQHYWYELLEKQGDMSRNEYRGWCKYYIGMPILIQNERYNYLNDVIKMIDWIKIADIKNSSTEEAKIDWALTQGCTALMTPDEMSRYLTGIKNHFEPLGFHLPSKNEDL